MSYKVLANLDITQVSISKGRRPLIAVNLAGKPVELFLGHLHMPELFFDDEHGRSLNKMPVPQEVKEQYDKNIS